MSFGRTGTSLPTFGVGREHLSPDSGLASRIPHLTLPLTHWAGVAAWRLDREADRSLVRPSIGQSFPVTTTTTTYAQQSVTGERERCRVRNEEERNTIRDGHHHRRRRRRRRVTQGAMRTSDWRRNAESGKERAELGQRRRKCPEQAYRQDSVWVDNRQSPHPLTQQQQQQQQQDLVENDGWIGDRVIVSEPRPSPVAAVDPLHPDPDSGIVVSPLSSDAAADADVRKKENLILDLDGNGGNGGSGAGSSRKSRRSSSVSSALSSTMTSSVCPETEYRQEFRCRGFHSSRPSTHRHGQAAVAAAAAAGRPSAPLTRHLMTTTTTTDGHRRPATSATDGDQEVSVRRTMRRQRHDDDDGISVREHQQQLLQRSQSLGVSEYKVRIHISP